MTNWNLTREGYTFVVGIMVGQPGLRFRYSISDMTLIAWWKNNATGTASNGTGAATLGSIRHPVGPVALKRFAADIR